jgi:hypothetical protein
MALRKGVERRELHQRVVVIWDSDYTRNEKARFAAIARRFIVGRVMGGKSAGDETCALTPVPAPCGRGGLLAGNCLPDILNCCIFAVRKWLHELRMGSAQSRSQFKETWYLIHRSGNSVKKTTEMNDELRPEYDLKSLLKSGVRGKYAKKYREGTNLVLLEPEIAKAFPNEKAVNDALRLVIELNKVQKQAKHITR